MLRKFLLGIVVVSMASLAWAGIPDPAQCIVESDADGWSLYINPLGTGTPLTDAYVGDGTQSDATIDLYVIDGNGNPIFLYSFEDMWLECDGVVFCASAPLLPRPNGGSTDSFGYTFWDGILYGGGCGTEGVFVVLAGDRLPTPVDLYINSADMTANLAVDALDTFEYVQLLGGSGMGAYCADFNFTGGVDALDTFIYVSSLGAACPIIEP